MILSVKTGSSSYDIILEQNALQKAGALLNLERKVLIVTDDGVPSVYAETVASFCASPTLVTLPQGEESKSIAAWQLLLETMLQKGFTRSDCVVAVGGGVMGDLAGFATASFMRGIDFYNIPTTVLSQVDSSVGGKTAVNLKGIKNSVGAFYPPRKVIIDPALLATLPPRQVSNGLAEAVKMALTCDRALFSLFEQRERCADWLSCVIEGALRIKKSVVEADEKEAGLRKVLNFGHTLGHGIESATGFSSLLHGECVALGMLPMCSPAVRARLIPVLERLGLPTTVSFDKQKALAAIAHDKKALADGVTVILTEEVGSFTMKKVPIAFLEEKLNYFC